MRPLLLTLEALVAITAIAGGLGLITSAITPPEEWLDSAPFDTYVIPGLALAIAICGGSLVALIAELQRRPFAPYTSALAGLTLCVFIVVEVAIIQAFSALQPFYFVIGLVIAALAWLEMHRITPDTP